MSDRGRTLSWRVGAGVVLAALVYALLCWAGNGPRVVESLRSISWTLLPLIALASLNYLIRFEKWHFFVGRLGFTVPRGPSLMVFLSGLVMSATPGKMGEVIKSYQLKRINGAPMSLTAPAVLVERLTDLVALLVLATAGGFALTGAPTALVVGTLVVTLTVAGLSSAKLCTSVTTRLGSVRRLKPGAMKLEQGLCAARALVRLGPLTFASLISIPAWFCECVGFWLVVRALGYPEVGLLHSTGIYSLGSVVGAVSMLPGGLGATELTLTGMLRASGVSTQDAVAATLVVRAATLWYAVLVGALFTSVLHVVFRERHVGAEQP